MQAITNHSKDVSFFCNQKNIFIGFVILLIASVGATIIAVESCLFLDQWSFTHLPLIMTVICSITALVSSIAILCLWAKQKNQSKDPGEEYYGSQTNRKDRSINTEASSLKKPLSSENFTSVNGITYEINNNILASTFEFRDNELYGLYDEVVKIVPFGGVWTPSFKQVLDIRSKSKKIYSLKEASTRGIIGVKIDFDETLKQPVLLEFGKNGICQKLVFSNGVLYPVPLQLPIPFNQFIEKMSAYLWDHVDFIPDRMMVCTSTGILHCAGRKFNGNSEEYIALVSFFGENTFREIFYEFIRDYTADELNAEQIKKTNFVFAFDKEVDDKRYYLVIDYFQTKDLQCHATINSLDSVAFWVDLNNLANKKLHEAVPELPSVITSSILSYILPNMPIR